MTLISQELFFSKNMSLIALLRGNINSYYHFDNGYDNFFFFFFFALN